MKILRFVILLVPLALVFFGGLICVGIGWLADIGEDLCARLFTKMYPGK